MTYFFHVPLDNRLVIYEFASELVVHYVPTLWVDKSTSSGRWLAAAKLGDLDALQAMVKYSRIQNESLSPEDRLLEERKWKTPYLAGFLARGGYLRALIWAQSQDCPIGSDTFVAAAEGGHMPVLIWLLEEQVPFDWRAGMAAARAGHLNVLKLLREVQCPFNEHTFAAAVMNGDIEILLWLRDQGCPWDQQVCDAVIRTARWDIFQWLKKEGCPWVTSAEESYLNLIAKEGNVPVTQKDRK